MSSLRQDFDFVHWVMNESELNVPLATRLDITKNIKRKIRNLLARNDHSPKFHYRDDSGESFWFKEYFNTTFSDEEKEEYIENEWVEINSPYDCTGRAFSTSIKIINFKEPNSLGKMSVVYHFMALDV